RVGRVLASALRKTKVRLGPARRWNVNTSTVMLPGGAPVNSKQLRPWQAKKMHDALAPALGYLSRLKRRMELTGFPPDDPLFIVVRDAQSKMHSLLVELHYMSCEGGVGRSPDRKP